MRLSAQKEELEAEFVAEMEELETDYQKQVYEMFLFGYLLHEEAWYQTGRPFDSPGRGRKAASQTLLMRTLLFVISTTMSLCCNSPENLFVHNFPKY